MSMGQRKKRTGGPAAASLPQIPNVSALELREPQSAQLNPPDVVAIIATNDEFDYVQDLIPDAAQPNTQNETGHLAYRFTYGQANPHSILLIVLGNQGELLANSVLMNTLYNLRHPPAAVVSVGISMSISKDVKLGDLVIAKAIERYLERARVEDANCTEHCDIRFAGEVRIELPKVVEKLNHFPKSNPSRFKQSYAQWQTTCAAEARAAMGDTSFDHAVAAGKIAVTPSLRYGIVLSGPFLVDSRNFKSKIIKEVGRNCQALDMESGGVVSAAVWIDKRKRPKAAVAIRGASDHGDGTKGADDAEKGVFRRIAMRNAFRSFLMLCQCDWFRNPE